MQERTRKIHIVGAGFSGLTLAALLSEHSGLEIIVYEKGAIGGLIQNTVLTEANTSLTLENSAISAMEHPKLTEFFKRYDFKIEHTLPEAKSKWIYYDGIKKWPLGFIDSVHLFLKLIRLFLFKKNIKHTLNEHSVKSWGEKYLTKTFTNNVLGVALLGVYAAPIDQLDAELVLSRFFNGQKKSKGSVIPHLGLSQFLKNLTNILKHKGVSFCSHEFTVTELTQISKNELLVWATSFSDFKTFLKNSSQHILKSEMDNKKTLQLIEKVRLNHLAKYHVLFESDSEKLNGFGLLFHPKHQTKALGCTINNCIFSDFGPEYSESWIFSGTDYTETEVRHYLQQERECLLKKRTRIKKVVGIPYKNAYPVYDVNLKYFINNLKLKDGIFLTGNYLGNLGLTQIFLQNLKLTESILNYDSTKN